MAHPLRRLALALVLVWPSTAGLAWQPAPPQERDFLSRIRRLTVDGRRSGEGYWAPDGRRLVFQSEREPGNPFYQIYLMDMSTGDVSRVSPGTGKTTCSFINPETGDVLFASTHHDPRSKQLQEEELTFRASGQERRYSWDYDPEMELYARSATTGTLRRLTNARGYDAEASYSPDGQWIVFASTRDAARERRSTVGFDEDHVLLEARDFGAAVSVGDPAREILVPAAFAEDAEGHVGDRRGVQNAHES
jgi:dipeptidyl aminopeptidase/acylaminoacyl peptidase